ncbi:aldo/keto reductase [Pseudolysinimonas kribbensis]
MTAAVPVPGSPEWLRPLGTTGLTVSAIGAGGGPLGGMPDARQAIGLVRHLLDSPIRVIDTSNGYSDGASEKRIGAGIAQHGGLPDGYLIATKVDARGGDYSGARIRDSIHESQDRLGLETFPLVHLHDPEYHPEAGFDLPGGAIEALVALRDEGVIEHLGIGAGHTPTIERLLDLGVFEVVLTHSRLTLLDRGADALVQRAHEAGIGVMNAGILGSGMLESRGGERYGYRPARPEVREAAQRLHDLADESGVDLPTAAVVASLRDPRIDATLVGSTNPARFDAMLTAIAAPIPDEFWERAAALLPEPSVWLDAER